jgi:hypothetical protein
MDMYISVQKPTQDIATLKTTWLISERNTTRAAKNMKRERCNNAGNASTAHGR